MCCGQARRVSKAIDLPDALPPVAAGPEYHDDAGALPADEVRPSWVRDACRPRRIEPIIPHRCTKGIKGVKDVGKLRYVVEQTFDLLHQFRRPAVRWNDALTFMTRSTNCSALLLASAV